MALRVSLLLCAQAWGWAMGRVAWFGGLSLAVMLLVLSPSDQRFRDLLTRYHALCEQVGPLPPPRVVSDGSQVLLDSEQAGDERERTAGDGGHGHGAEHGEEHEQELLAQVEVRVKKRVKRLGKLEEMGELSIQFGSLDELNGLIEKLRA